MSAPGGRWEIYLTNKSSGRLEWASSLVPPKNFEECFAKASWMVNGGVESNWYKAPVGRGYRGDNRVISYLFNWYYMGKDMKCLAKTFGMDPDIVTQVARYWPILRDEPKDRTDWWYCL
jgi:hypothetical protein